MLGEPSSLAMPPSFPTDRIIHGGPLGSSPDGAEGLAGRFAASSLTSPDLDGVPVRRREPVRVRPFHAPELPRPREPSGLLPAAEVRPEPPIALALRLRRAVALTVVLGTVSLLAYAGWQRVAHDRELPPAGALARP